MKKPLAFVSTLQGVWLFPALKIQLITLDLMKRSASLPGDPVDVTISVRDVRFNILGNVSRYEFNTSRDSVDLLRFLISTSSNIVQLD